MSCAELKLSVTSAAIKNALIVVMFLRSLHPLPKWGEGSELDLHVVRDAVLQQVAGILVDHENLSGVANDVGHGAVEAAVFFARLDRAGGDENRAGVHDVSVRGERGAGVRRDGGLRRVLDANRSEVLAPDTAVTGRLAGVRVIGALFADEHLLQAEERGDFILIDLTADGGAAAEDGLDRADHLRMALQRTPDGQAHDQGI